MHTYCSVLIRVAVELDVYIFHGKSKLLKYKYMAVTPVSYSCVSYLEIAQHVLHHSLAVTRGQSFEKRPGEAVIPCHAP